MCQGQLVPSAFTVINAFCIACHLVDEVPPPEVFSHFYKLTRPKDQYLYTLSPMTVRIESGVSVKFGCFAECRDSWGSWK